jgi:hypothetical protein
MGRVRRHLAVFLLLMVAAYAISYAVPHDVDPKYVFRALTLAFLFYIAVDLLLLDRRAGGTRNE